MDNWEQRLQALWQLIQLRITTSDPVLLGLCAYLQKSIGIPCVGSRLVLLVATLIWPVWTLIVYVVASFFIQSLDEAP